YATALHIPSKYTACNRTGAKLRFVTIYNGSPNLVMSPTGSTKRRRLSRQKRTRFLRLRQLHTQERNHRKPDSGRQNTPGLHCEPYFADVARDALPGVEGLAPRLIGLPTAPNLAASEIQRIVGAIARGRDHVSG